MFEDRIEASTGADCLRCTLSLRQAQAKGWHLVINGREVPAVSISLQGYNAWPVALRRGDRITLRYVDLTASLLKVLAALSWLALFIGCFFVARGARQGATL
jgi:hypothetical protein